MDEDSYGFLDEALLRPPQILGCERSPFIAVIFAATFVTVVGFGITLQGLVGGVMLAAAGIMLLRRIAVYDPFYFAILFEAARYPRDMPDVLPDRTLPKLAFVGYDDPPSDAAVLLARLVALAIVVLPAGATWALFGLVPALGTLVVMAAAMTYIIVRYMPRTGQN